MAEISESSNPSSSSSSSSNDNTNVRSSKPGTKRLCLTLSVLVSFLLALPFLFLSTEIYRSPLPFSSIASLSSRLTSHPPSFPSRLHAVFISPHSLSSSPLSLSSSISRSLQSKPSPSSSINNSTVSVTVAAAGRCESTAAAGGDIWKCGALDGIKFGGNVDDEAVDELLDSIIGGARAYTVVVIQAEEEEVRVVVGKHRHAWIVGKVSEEDAVEMISEIFVKVFLNGGREEDGNGEEGEFMPVGLDGSLVLSFSLLNADPNHWVYDW